MKLIIILIHFLHLSLFLVSCDNITDAINLDKTCADLLTNPVEGKGQQVLDDSYKFYLLLDDILRNMEMEDLTAKDLEFLQAIQDNGGPYFIRAPYKPRYMRKVFNYTRENMSEIRATVNALYKMWDVLEEFALKNKTTT